MQSAIPTRPGSRSLEAPRPQHPSRGPPCRSTDRWSAAQEDPPRRQRLELSPTGPPCQVTSAWRRPHQPCPPNWPPSAAHPARTTVARPASRGRRTWPSPARRETRRDGHRRPQPVRAIPALIDLHPALVGEIDPHRQRRTAAELASEDQRPVQAAGARAESFHSPSTSPPPSSTPLPGPFSRSRVAPHTPALRRRASTAASSARAARRVPGRRGARPR